MRRTLAFLLLMVISFSLIWAEGVENPTLLLNDPSVSPDGNTVVFAYQGDLLSVPITGGEARRLTIHIADERTPLISPDGTQIAYSANYYGSYDIFVMPINGGKPIRLTWLSSSDTPTSWSADGRFIYFSSNRDTNATVYRIPVAGGTPAKLVEIYNDPVYGAAPSPDGKKLLMLYRSGYSGFDRRRNYNPGTAEIYMADNTVPASNFVRLTDNLCQDFLPTWAADGASFYYLSDEDGSWNLYRRAISTNKTDRVTKFTDTGIKWFSVARATGTIVAERNHRLYTIDPTIGEPRLIPVTIADMPKYERETSKTEDTNVTDYDISPDGKKVAFISGHDIFVMASEGGYAKQFTRTAVRESDIAWSPDSKFVIFNRICEGGQNIFRLEVATGVEEQLTHGRDNCSTPIYGPNRSTITYQFNYDEIRSMDLDGSNVRTLVKGTFSRRILMDERWFGFTPNRKFLTYIECNDIMRQECKVKRLGTDDPPIVMSYIGGNSNIGNFTLDYSHFVFTNYSTEKPIIHVVDFREPEPEVPQNPKDVLDELLTPPDKKKKPTVKKKEFGPDSISFDDISVKSRVAFPNFRDQQDWPVLLKDSETILFIGGSDICKATIRGSGKVIIRNWYVGGIKTKLKVDHFQGFGYVINNGDLFRFSVKSGGVKQISPNQMIRELEIENQRIAVMDEYLWVLESAFYDPALHGVNIVELRARYLPLVHACKTDEEFQEVMNEIVGEFNASHMGFYLSKDKKPGTVSENIPHLGFLYDDKEIEEGRLVVRRIIEDSPAAKKNSGLKVGDRILSVNGHSVEKGVNVYSLLADTSGKEIDLVVAGDSANAEPRTVHLPVSSTGQMYRLCDREWLEGNRKYVLKESGGKLGYIYIASMMQPDYDKLKEDLQKYVTDFKGVVLDFRYNGGGFIAFKVVELLQQREFNIARMRGGKPVSEDILRDFVYPHRVVGMFNFGSFSNAEMMLSAFTIAGLGPTVGTPTAGGVIGTWSRQLVDGSFMRLPQFGMEDINGRNLELSPTKPGHIVDRDLVAQVKGQNPQLDKAIEILMTGKP